MTSATGAVEDLTTVQPEASDGPGGSIHTSTLVRIAVVGGLLSASRPARAVDTFTRDTFAPYTVNDVNALIGNHYFVQSMLAFDAAPLTIGISNFQTRADWARTDGSIYRGSLNRTKYLFSVGGGHPTSGAAVYVVGNMDGIYAGPFPAFFENANDDGHVRAVSYGAVAAVGVAYHGWVGQLAYFYHNTKMDTDGLGRFTNCDAPVECTEPRVRDGAPAQSWGHAEVVTAGNTMLTLENGRGYSTGVLLAPREVDTGGAEPETQTALASLRALAEPYDLFPKWLGVLGAGLTTFGRGLDYYGDLTEQTQEAVEAQEPPPPPADKGIVEFPFSAQRIGETGATARIVIQASPLPAFRLAEAGYFYEGDPEWRFLPQIGGRAKLFKRASGYVPSADAYAGFFWVFRRQDSPGASGRGLSAYATYSYNSPDAANLVPLANAHILGLQAVFGNPSALPPPSSLIKYPSMLEEAP